MKNLGMILFLILIFLCLMGCAHDPSQQQQAQKTAFHQALEENTLQCKKSIEKSNLSNIRSKIFWIAGLNKPTEEMQSNENFVQDEEKAEIEKLNQLVEFCQNMYSRTITSFINAEYGERFKDHLHSKLSNLNELNDGKINYGRYNRDEFELGQRLTRELQFLDEKYRPQMRRQSSLTPVPSFPSGKSSLARDSANVMQILFLELLFSLPKLIL